MSLLTCALKFDTNRQTDRRKSVFAVPFPMGRGTSIVRSLSGHSPTGEVLVFVVSESVRRGTVRVQQLVGKLRTAHAPVDVVVEEVLEFVGREDGRLASLDHRLMQHQPAMVQTFLGREPRPETSQRTWSPQTATRLVAL